jgi:hypothetical protein
MQTTVVTVGQDGLVIVWKDCRVQRALRSNLANAALLSQMNGNVATNGALNSFPDLSLEKNTEQTTGASQGLLQDFPLSESLVPAYILDFAKTLRDEKKLTTNQILDQLQVRKEPRLKTDIYFP